MSIDPKSPPWYNKTTPELEEIIIFCILVAGKNAQTSAYQLNELWWRIDVDYDKHIPGYFGIAKKSPFEIIKEHVSKPLSSHIVNRVQYGRNRSKIPKTNSLSDLLKWCSFGCYNQKAKTILDLINANLDLRTCTLNDLLAIKGIGQKTARFFLLHTRQNANLAILDRHILKYLTYLGFNVPLTTPQNINVYQDIENIFLYIAKANNIDAAKLDIAIWNLFSTYIDECTKSFIQTGEDPYVSISKDIEIIPCKSFIDQTKYLWIPTGRYIN